MYVFRVSTVVVNGSCRGRAAVIDDYISFFGEVDPERGVHRVRGKRVADRVLVFRGSRGSTVGSYIIYSMKKNGKSPICFIVSRVDPVLVAGAVLAEIPLLVVEDFDSLISTVDDGDLVEYCSEGGVIRVYKT